MASASGQPSQVSRPQPTPDDLWQEAVKLLHPDQQQQLIIGAQDKLTVLNDALTLAKEKRDDCIRKQWKITRSDGTTIVLREIFDRIVNWVERLKNVGDLVARVMPLYAEIPWAAVSLFLSMSINDAQQFASVLEGIELLTNLIARYALVEAIYLQQSSKTVDLLRQAIVVFYARILTYLAAAKRYYTQNTGRRIAKSVVQLSEHGLSESIKEIQSQQAICDELARLVDADRLRLGFEGTNQSIEQLRTALSNLQQPLQNVEAQLVELVRNLKVSTQHEILDWLSELPYTQHHDSVRRDRQGYSGLWLLSDVEYLRWRQTSSSALLWIHGIPVCGKSTIVSLVVDMLRSNALNIQSHALAYVFCLRNTAESDRADPDAILRCILRQLSCSGPTAPIRVPVVQKFRELQHEGFTPRRLTIEESTRLILDLLEDEPATIIVDAIDQCDPDRRYLLLNALEHILQHAKSPVKILISSRDQDDIVSRMNNYPNIYIDAGRNQDDIDTFVDSEVDRAVTEKTLLAGNASVDLQRMLKERLRTGADGMFLWVSLQIQHLCRHRFEADIRDQLGKIPLKLVQMYSEIYSQILAAGPVARKLAATALRWLMCVEKPLATHEFMKAISLDATGQYTTLTSSTLLDICGNLIKIDTELDIFRFSHPCVREFLEGRPDYAPSITHAVAADICLNTLLAKEWLLADVSWQKAALYEYVTLYWASHRERSGQPFDARSGITFHDLFSHNGQVAPWFAKWLLQVDSASQTLVYNDPLKDKILQSLSANPETCFFTACSFGFFDVVQSLVQANALVVRRSNASGASGLHLACYYGHPEIVQFLLENGAMINATDGEGESALTRASAGGHVDIVRKLLSRDADRGIRGSKYGSALQAASLRGHLAIVRQLLDEINLEAVSGQFGTALEAAALRGHTQIVLLLLGKGAEVNAPGGDYAVTPKLTGDETTSDGVLKAVEYLLEKQRQIDEAPPPFWASPQRRFESMVQLLLDQDIDINMQQEGFGPALQAASRGGHVDTVETLIMHGADINAEGGAYGTALQAAAVSGAVHVVQVLLSAGADINMLCGTYNTALQAACRFNHDAIVHVLLVNYADINAEGGVYGTALQAAVRSGNKGTIKRLLHDGADVNAVAGTYGTALQAAAEQGSDDIVKVLLDSGANPNIESGKFGSALQAATARGHRRTANILLEHKAAFGRSLQIACLTKDEHLIKYLLDKGADPTSEGGTFGTPVGVASGMGQNHVVRMLLERDAKLSGLGQQNLGPALAMAVENGNEDIVRLLLDKGADPSTTGDFSALSNSLATNVSNAIGLVHGQPQTQSDDDFGNGEFQRYLKHPKSVLALAVMSGHLDITKMLLQEIRQREDDRSWMMAKRSVLAFAARTGREDAVQFLLDGGIHVPSGGGGFQLSPIGSPMTSPVMSPSVTPVASPWTSPMASPVAHAVAFPPGSPIVLPLASPLASPVASAMSSPIGHLNDPLPTALREATIGNYVNIVQLLMRSGASILDQTEAGTPLHVASHFGQTELVDLFLRSGASPRAIGEAKCSAIFLASCRGKIDILRMLLAQGAQVDEAEAEYSSCYRDLYHFGAPLHAAAYYGFLEIVELLIDHNAEVNRVAGDYGTALQAACAGGHEPVVLLLLQRKAGLSLECGLYGTALQAAVCAGSQRIVGLLLSQGADPNANGNRDGKYGSALQAAAASNNTILVKMLLAAGATAKIEGGPPPDSLLMPGSFPSDRERKGTVKAGDTACNRHQSGRFGTALQAAADVGNVEIVRLLLDSGADIQDTDEHGQTPVHRAAYQGHADVLKMLLDQGGSVNHADKQGQTALRWVANRGFGNLLGLLWNKGASVERMDDQGSTALHWAATKGHVSIARDLLDHGANIELGNVRCETPLMLAAGHGMPEMVRFLLSRGARINVYDKFDGTAIHHAARQSNHNVVRPLIDGGANVNWQVKQGPTALHIAAETSNYEVPYVLIMCNASLEAKDIYGQTPLIIAARVRDCKVLRLLLTKGADPMAKDYNDMTALHAAVRALNRNAVRVLLRTGADINAKAGSWGTPLNMVRQREHDFQFERGNHVDRRLLSEIRGLLRENGGEC